MKCPSCQEDTQDTDNFCPHCGTPLIPSEAAPRQGGVTANVSKGELSIGGSIVGRDLNLFYLYTPMAPTQQGKKAESLDVPLLHHIRAVEAPPGLPTKGIQFTDAPPSGEGGSPQLFLSVFFKTSGYFGDPGLALKEKWLLLQADMRPALNLRIQVRALNQRDISGLMQFLRRGGAGWALRGKGLFEGFSDDVFHVWRENEENRLVLATFTPTFAGISVHARFSSEVATAFAAYLEEVGFA